MLPRLVLRTRESYAREVGAKTSGQGGLTKARPYGGGLARGMDLHGRQTAGGGVKERTRSQEPPWEVIDANRRLNILRATDSYQPPFEILRNYHLVDDGEEPEATVVVRAGATEVHEADTGVGPVDALANTLKKALKPAFPFIEEVRLVDFAARIHESHSGTKATVEVTVFLSDGVGVWKVSKLSRNINQASFHALADGYEFAIVRRLGPGRRREETGVQRGSTTGRKHKEGGM